MTEKSIYLETERCGDCSGRFHRSDEGACLGCFGSGRKYSLTMAHLMRGFSYRIADLLIQVAKDGHTRGRFDHWKAEQWQAVCNDAGLHSMLRNVGTVRKPKPGPWQYQTQRLDFLRSKGWVDEN